MILSLEDAVKTDAFTRWMKTPQPSHGTPAPAALLTSCLALGITYYQEPHFLTLAEICFPPRTSSAAHHLAIRQNLLGSDVACRVNAIPSNPVRSGDHKRRVLSSDLTSLVLLFQKSDTQDHHYFSFLRHVLTLLKQLAG